MGWSTNLKKKKCSLRGSIPTATSLEKSALSASDSSDSDDKPIGALIENVEKKVAVNAVQKEVVAWP
ncbi:unnamed protein product, partial [Citrullus colocynthis]